MIGNSYEFLRGKAQLAAPAFCSLLFFSVCMDLLRSLTVAAAAQQGRLLPFALLTGKVAAQTIVPWILYRKGYLRAAMLTYLFVAMGMATTYTLISSGMYSSGGVLQLSIVLAAALMLGRDIAIAAAVPALLCDLIMVVLELQGIQLPRLLADTPVMRLTNILAACGAVSIPLYHLLQHMNTINRDMLTLMDTVPECIKVLSPQMKLLSLNAAGRRYLGYKDEDSIRGKDVLAGVREKNREAFLDTHRKAAEGHPGQVEYQVRTADGRYVWFEANAVPLRDLNGHPVAALSVSRDVTERKRMEAEQQRILDRLREVTSHLDRVQEEERLRISREIHDELGQQLTGLKMHSAWVSRLLNEDPARAARELERLHQGLALAVRTVSRVAGDLRPVVLEKLGLAPSLEWVAMKIARTSGLAYRTQLEDISVTPPTAMALYRVTQEALTNVVKHSQASSFQLALRRAGSAAELEIRDDGVGLSDESLAKITSFGIAGMRERLASVGGEMNLENAPGRGLILRATVPLQVQAAAV